jgi:hypothetical protein
MTVARAAIGLAAIGLAAPISACFHPSYSPQEACGRGGACPGGTMCNMTSGFCEGPGGGPIVDASTGDAIGPGGPVHVCLGTFVNVCADVPRGGLNLMTETVDTSDISASTKCLPAGAYTTQPAVDACVIASQTITIPSGNTISVTGRKRLILLADEVLTVTGKLDAASRGGDAGPAADTGPCLFNVTNPTTAIEGGGGWGGTFGKVGNNGGSTPSGGLGGEAGSQLQITTLGGGCPGGAGANNSSGAGGGNGGHGGGAVLLLAGQRIAIDGVVNASGAGGTGGKARGGGGGGGAGGMIILEAPIVRITGQCFANGGGGGEGGSVLNGADGGESSAPDAAGSGGTNNPIGGSGGTGGVGTTGSKGGGDGVVDTPTDTGGGGGGGGGVGIIKILSADPGTISDLKKVSPPPS